MKTLIQVDVSPERLGANPKKGERLKRTRQFLPTDRVPVKFDFTVSGVLRARGVRVGEYFENADTQFHHQLLNLKWRLEQLHDDEPLPEKSITLAPDFQCVRAECFPVEVRWQEDELPKTMPLLREASEIEALTLPEPTENLFGQKLKWFHRMQELAQAYVLRIGPNEIQIKIGLGMAGGPIPDAFALAGEQLFLWMAEEPERVHLLMEKVTQTRLKYRAFLEKLLGPGGAGAGNGMGCDTGELLSARHFRAFVLPYYRHIYETWGGSRGLHMCGKIDHLLPILAEELKIGMLNGFGFVTDKEKLASTLGGRAILTGGPSPMLIQSGPKDSIRSAALEYLKSLAPLGGYILSSGYSMAPNTPIAHAEVLLEASREFGDAGVKAISRKGEEATHPFKKISA